MYILFFHLFISMGVNSLPTFNVITLKTKKVLMDRTLTELISQTARELTRISQKLNKLSESPKPRFPLYSWSNMTILFAVYVRMYMCVGVRCTLTLHAALIPFLTTPSYNQNIFIRLFAAIIKMRL